MIGEKLQYALKDNILVSVNQVEKGLACNCICPSCKSQLVARKGEVREHHFAHYKNNSCATGYQTSLHLLAKELIQEKRRIKIPPVYCDILCIDPNEPEGYSFDEREKREEQLLSNVNVTLEKKENGIIPDIIIQYGNYKLYVEIYVTHKVDSEKIQIAKQNNISMMEIDLHKEKRIISKEELSIYLFEDTSNSYWINNKYQNEINKEMLIEKDKFVKEREIAIQKEKQEIEKERKLAKIRRQQQVREYFTKGICPICLSSPFVKYRTLEGRIVFICASGCDCSYLMTYEYRKILEERYGNTQEYNYQQIMTHRGLCHKCKYDLVVRNDKNGPFISCSNYKCKSTFDYGLLNWLPEKIKNEFKKQKEQFNSFHQNKKT